MRIPLPAGAWLDHDPAWLPGDEADAALAELRGELRWEQREIAIFGRRVLQPRLIAWAGELGYRYSGQTLEPRAFTPAVSRQLVARSGDQYVDLAAGLIRDRPRLAMMRRELRERVESSPLMDLPRFARNLEAAFRTMWHAWCDRALDGRVDRR